MSDGDGWICRGDVHTLPVGDLVDHDETRTCWCDPVLRAVCPEECESGCWRCGYDEGGMIDIEADYDGAPSVIHNAADGRE